MYTLGHAPELQVFSFTPVVTHTYLAHVWTLHGVSDHEGHRKLSAELGMTCLVRKPVHYLFTADGETQHWY